MTGTTEIEVNVVVKKPEKGVFSEVQYEKQTSSPEQTAGWFSQLTFTWVNPIFRISAAKRKLGEELETSDLWSCIPQDTAVHLIKRWDDAWNRKSKNAMDRKRHGEEVAQKESFWLFFGTMRGIFIKTLWKGFVLRALTILMYFAVPFFLNGLLEYIDNRDVKPVSDGVLLVVGLVAAQAVRVFVENAYFQTIVRFGWQTFTMLNSAVYQKSLRLSSSSRQSRTVGDMVNILQLDTMKLQYWCESIQQLWGSPVQVVGYVIILYIFIGWAAFVGLAVLVSITLLSPALYSLISKWISKQIKVTDTRVKVTNECLQGALAVKMAAWEENFADKINALRSEELYLHKKLSLLTSFGISLIQAAPTFGAVAAIVTYAFSGNELTAPTIFTAIATFQQVAQPLGNLVFDIANTAQAMVSIQRVGDFMMMEEVDQSGEWDGASQDGSVHIHDAEFSWARGTAKSATKKKKLNKKKKKSRREQESLESSKGEIGTNSASVLKDMNLDVKPKSLTAIIGPVGAGKSSLCGAIIGELHTKRGKVQVNGSVAYAAQTPWILNATLRDNILFGEEFNYDRYWKVIRVCQLRHDLDVLKAGDMTMIGEKGINLSGGQKQRVSIARAAYSSKQIVLLDDPLSALDPEVASNVFNDCIRKFMSDRTRILVTNQLNFLRFCDWVVVLTTSDKGIEDIAAEDSVAMNGMRDTGRSEANPEKDVQTNNVQETVPGYVSEQGTFQDLMNGDSSFASLVQKYNKQKHKQRDLDAESQHERDGSTAANDPSSERKSFAEDTLMQVEERSRGSVKLKDYRGYVKAGGGYVAFAFLILLLSLQNTSLVLSSAWVGLWTRAEERNYTTFESGEPVFFDSIVNESLELYAYGYIVAGAALMLFAFMAAAGFTLFTLHASETMHNKVLTSVLNSPMSFFDTTPLGRIIARFSADMTTLDMRLSETLAGFCAQLISGIGILVTISIATPWFLAFILPLSLIYRYVLQIFRPVTRQLQRISSIARSPIYSHFSETIGGLTTIRSYNKVELFAKQNIFRVNQFAEAFAIQRSADRWLAIRLEFIGILVVAAAAGLAVGGTVDAAVAGISLTYAITITTLLNYGVRSFSYLENGMNSYERVNYYATQIEQEQPRRSSNPPDKTWPSKGEIVLNNLRMRYREGTPLVLKGLSLTIRGGERVGVVGRTGSGKSSLMLCLLRLVEPEDAMTSSPIMIDGIDVCKIGLYELRRKISIVPQNPTIFSGTVRSNLDPFTQYSDKEIWGALEKVGLKQLVSQSPGKLEFILSEFGENFSQGQRQLLCLARTLLNRSQILLLDEATSSIDFETDMLIQNTIRSKTSFDGCTILTIAHRINTVLDSDRILVLNEGRVAEYDSPEVLLEDSTSMFSQMAQARDEES